LVQERQIHNRNGHAIGIRTTVVDVSKLKWAEANVSQSQSHDPLTGLLNRTAFHGNVVIRLVERTKSRKNRLFALLCLDLDRFRSINQSLGEPAGDQLLVAVGQLLRASVRKEDTLARLGQDQFGILLQDVKDVRDALRVADRIQKKLALPFNLAGQRVSIAASIGIALSAAGYERAEDLLRDAETALSRAKEIGGSSYQVFDTAQHTRAMELLQLENELRQAIERQELRVHYQPIVSVESGGITGFEALVRWEHPGRGLVFPAEFIPIAEETGLIVPIGSWVFREACQQMRAWQERFRSIPPLYVTVNFSAKQFAQPDLLEQIDLILLETGMDGSNLGLEITESMILESAEATVRTLSQLRERRIRLYVDDFGTGYSSLSHLHRFPIDALKIDRSFVSEMDSNGQNSKIVRAILGLASNFDMSVTVEGVETEEQMAELRALKCKEVQGFFFSPPVDSATAESLMARQESFSTPVRFKGLVDSRPGRRDSLQGRRLAQRTNPHG